MIQGDSDYVTRGEADEVAGDSRPVTILEVALFRLRRMLDEDEVAGIPRPDVAARVAEGSVTGGDLALVGFCIMGGCERCGASIAAYNAHPSRSGFWRCGDCIGPDGWATVEEADKALQPKEYSVKMEYSVLVTADDLYGDEELTPELAEKIALGWMDEDPKNCNPVGVTVQDASGKVVRVTEL